MITRRGFLKLLGVAAAAPSAVAKGVTPPDLPVPEPVTGGWYSGYDLLPVYAGEIRDAGFYKRTYQPVIITGLEKLR